MSNILIIGAYGRVGSKLVEVLQKTHHTVFAGSRYVNRKEGRTNVSALKFNLDWSVQEMHTVFNDHQIEVIYFYSGFTRDKFVTGRPAWSSEDDAGGRQVSGKTLMQVKQKHISTVKKTFPSCGRESFLIIRDTFLSFDDSFDYFIKVENSSIGNLTFAILAK